MREMTNDFTNLMLTIFAMIGFGVCVIHALSQNSILKKALLIFVSVISTTTFILLFKFHAELYVGLPLVLLSAMSLFISLEFSKKDHLFR